MSSETFSHIAAGIQSLVIALAVIIGGIWALVKLNLLKQIEKVNWEIAEMRKRLRERGILDITIRPKEIGRVEGSIHYVLVEVTIHNKGNRSEVIDWRKSGVHATKTNLDRDGSLGFDETHIERPSLPGLDLLTTSILAGEKKVISFLCRLESGGLYHLMFLAEVSTQEETIDAEEHRAAGIAVKTYKWQTSTYFNVK